jgi:hypothetical protein
MATTSPLAGNTLNTELTSLGNPLLQEEEVAPEEASLLSVRPVLGTFRDSNQLPRNSCVQDCFGAVLDDAALSLTGTAVIINSMRTGEVIRTIKLRERAPSFMDPADSAICAGTVSHAGGVVAVAGGAARGPPVRSPLTVTIFSISTGAEVLKIELPRSDLKIDGEVGSTRSARCPPICIDRVAPL